MNVIWTSFPVGTRARYVSTYRPSSVGRTINSGVRLGSPAGTSRGFGIAEFRQVGELIVEVLDALSHKNSDEDAAVEAAVRDKVKRLISRFPIY